MSRSPSSLPLDGSREVDRAVHTPRGPSPLLENDSPLPSPPSISKPKDYHRQLHSPRHSDIDADADQGGPEPAATTAERRPRSPSPTPASVTSRALADRAARDRLGETSSPPLRPPSLAESMGASRPTRPPTASTSSVRPHLEAKLGIRPSASSRPTASLRHALRSASYEAATKETPSAGATDSSVPSTSSHPDGAADTGRRRNLDSAAQSSRNEDRAPYSTRATGSQARRTRERTAEPVPLDTIGKKRTWGGEEVLVHRRTSDEAPKSRIQEGADCERPTADSDHAGHTESGSQGSSSPDRNDVAKALPFSTPGLTTAARSALRSALGTAGRSTARTLKRYGANEARPQHVRPTRVMLTQGADESDDDEEDEPGVGVGLSPAQEKRPTTTNSPFHSPVQSEPRAMRDDMELERGRAQSKPESAPFDGAPHLTDQDSSSSQRRAAASQPLAPPLRAPETLRNTESEKPNRGPLLTAGTHLNGRHPESHDLAGTSVSVGHANSQTGAGGERHRPGAYGERNTQSSYSEAPRPERRILSVRRHETGASTQPQNDVDGKENVEPIRPVEPRSNARGGPLLEAVGVTKPHNKGIAQMASRPTPPRVETADFVRNSPAQPDVARPSSASFARAPIGVVEEKCKPLPEAPAALQESTSTTRTGAAYTRLAAEKQRLLDLNGWDPWVRAALDEAERQRMNGCTFGEQMVGKAMSSRKETKFRGAKYLKVSRAGEGGFSTVFQVLGPVAIPTVDGGSEPVPEELQAYFAMKQVSLKRLEQSSRDELLQEAQLLESLAVAEDSDRYVLRYFGHKHSGDTLKILMELGEMDFNTLLRTKHPLPRAALSEYWRQMLESVHFVHKAKLVHTDLKPANFLLVKGRIKLIDFGIAQKIPLGTIHISRDVIVGTPNYMAPEAIQKARRGGHGVYKAGTPSDVWSLGCILYQMVYGRTPFAHISGDRKLEVITDSRHQIAFPKRRCLDDSRQAASEREDDEQPAEELDEIVLDCMRASLVYKAQSRATIPNLLEHLFVRDEVTLSRQKLKSIVLRIQTYMQQGGLNEDNVEEMADRLMTNLELDAFEPFAAIQAA
ncbi:unnamed protein product [Parajaminaea phylloscopi]